jgi:hypothetical protein
VNERDKTAKALMFSKVKLDDEIVRFHKAIGNTMAQTTLATGMMAAGIDGRKV